MPAHITASPDATGVCHEKQHARMLHLTATGIVPSAAINPALLPTFAPAAPGDLDPNFDERGRSNRRRRVDDPP
jgi:hypothetical protein